MRPLLHIVTAISILALTGSCSIMKKNSTTAVPAPAKTAQTTVASANDATAPSIMGFVGDWSIVEINGKSVKVNGENHPKLSFEVEESKPDHLAVIGFNGCNYINGTWAVGKGTITPAGEFITSLMSCPDAIYEQAMNAALNKVAAYSFTTPQQLVLLSTTGNPVMKLRKQSLDFINGAWKVTNIENRDIDASIKIVIDTNEGRVHGNAGCNILNGTIIVNYDKGYGIEFQNLATSRMMCPDIAEEQAFLLALEQVATATPGKNADTAYLCNQAGQKIMTLRRLADNEITDK